MEKKKKDRLVIAILILAVVILVLAGFAVKLNYMLGGGYREDRMKSHEEMMNWFEQKIKESEKHGQAQMMDYLEERYHEKFVMKGYIDCLGNWYGNYVEMKACPEGKDDGEHLFIVEGKPDDSGNLEYRDSYFYILIEKDFLKYFEPVMEDYFDDFYCKVYFAPEYSTISPKISGNATVEELLEYRAGKDYEKPVLSIYSEKRLMPETQRFFCRELQIMKFQGTVSIRTTDGNGEVLEVDIYDIDSETIHKD